MGQAFAAVVQVLDRFRSNGASRYLLLAFDGVIAGVGLSLAMLLRFEGDIPPDFAARLPMLTILIVVCRILATVVFKLHRWSYRYSGLVDGARVWLAIFFGSGLFLLACFFTGLAGPPRTVVVMELLISGVGMVVLRFSPRLTYTFVVDQARARVRAPSHALIIGAGSAGELLLRDLQRSDRHGYSVVGFLDDNASLHGMIVGGKPVVGRIADLRRVARAHHVEHVLIAIPRLEARRIREILSLCTDLKLQFKILPISFVYLDERASASMLQDLSPEDLLQREEVRFASSGESQRVSNRSALVTGAAGSIGAEICRQLLEGRASKLVMVDMNENGLYLMQRRFEREFPGARVVCEVADIRDQGRMGVLFAVHRPQDVFHAAAHKHVPLMESAPGEAVKNNILGTRNVAEAAHSFSAERFVYISTDKAVRPSSVMGASKRVGEEVVRMMARRSATRFCAVRFGNVLGSAGSVVPLFRDQIAAGGPVTVTHPDVRRYFMTISEAVGLVLRAGYGDFGELCVLDMGEQLPIIELARHMIAMAGKTVDVDIKITFTGLRPGEKLAEELLTEEEERTSRAAHKIFVASCPPVRSDLEDRIAELARAAHSENHEIVIGLLRGLVPSYKSPVRPAAALCIGEAPGPEHTALVAN